MLEKYIWSVFSQLSFNIYKYNILLLLYTKSILSQVQNRKNLPIKIMEILLKKIITCFKKVKKEPKPKKILKKI